MRINFDPDRISKLRTLANGGDDYQFRKAVDLHAGCGFPIEEIQQALQGTEWRYVIEGSGTAISVDRSSELLGYYADMIEALAEEICKMSCLAAVKGGSKDMLRHLDEREELGRSCFEIVLEGRRIRQYLLPDDELPDPKIDLGRLLSKAGFDWDGAYEVEMTPGSRPEPPRVNTSSAGITTALCAALASPSLVAGA